MKSNRILVVIVIALIIINCALLSFLWLNIYHVKKQRPPIQGPAFEFLSRELKLTSTQKIQYEKLRNAHMQSVDSLNAQSRTLHDSLFDGLKNPALNPSVTIALAKKIGETSAMVDTATFYHFRRFRAILTTAQQEKFDKVIQDVLNSMGGPQQGGQPGQEGPKGMRPGSPQGGQPQNGPHGKGMPHPGGQPPNGPRGNDGQHPGGPPPNGGPPPGWPPPGSPPPPGGGHPGGPPPNGGPPPQR